MDFTREPIIETVITPRDGHKIVVRSSKTVGQEEYFVEAVEIVTFGSSSFFRSLERPKAFLVPTSDYEVLEVREARIVLKNVGLERSIKIAGGKEAPQKKEDKADAPQTPKEEAKAEGQHARRKDRRRQQRRRPRVEESEESQPQETPEEKIHLALPEPQAGDVQDVQPMGSILSSLLTPPTTLISDKLKEYKENALFKDAFYTKEELEEAEIFAAREMPEATDYEVTINNEESALNESEEPQEPSNAQEPQQDPASVPDSSSQSDSADGSEENNNVIIQET